MPRPRRLTLNSQKRAFLPLPQNLPWIKTTDKNCAPSRFDKDFPLFYQSPLSKARLLRRI